MEEWILTCFKELDIDPFEHAISIPTVWDLGLKLGYRLSSS